MSIPNGFFEKDHISRVSNFRDWVESTYYQDTAADEQPLTAIVFGAAKQVSISEPEVMNHDHAPCDERLRMNATDQPNDSSAHVDKGKQRARDPTEHTPLLGSSSALLNDAEASIPANSHRRLRTTLTTVFLVSLSICITLFVVIALLALSYASKASNLKPEDIVNHHLVFAGPDKVDVLNVTREGVWLHVHGRIGLDAGQAIDINTDLEDGPLRELWKAIGRWSVRTLDKVSVNMSTITVTPEYDTAPLVLLDIAPLELPLSVDPPQDLSWLTPVSAPVHVRLTANNTHVIEFLKESWRNGVLSVRAEVGQARVRGGGLDRTSWRSTFHGQLSNIRTSIRIQSALSSDNPLMF